MTTTPYQYTHVGSAESGGVRDLTPYLCEVETREVVSDRPSVQKKKERKQFKVVLDRENTEVKKLWQVTRKTLHSMLTGRNSNNN